MLGEWIIDIQRVMDLKDQKAIRVYEQSDFCFFILGIIVTFLYDVCAGGEEGRLLPLPKNMSNFQK